MSGQVTNIIGSILDPDDTSKSLQANMTSCTSGSVNTLSFSSSTNRIFSFPDATTDIVGHDASQILSNKTLSGSSNTFTDINGSCLVSGSVPNSALTNPSITITPGTGLSGGGVTSLGGTVNISNSGVTSVSGTANQVSSSSSTGSTTLSIPSTFIVPGSAASTTTLTAGTLFYEGTTSGISAAGTNQGTAASLTKTYNVVNTVASGTGVILPVPTSSGLVMTIVNKGLNNLNIYPASGGTIDDSATNSPIILPVNGKVTCQSSSTTQWYSKVPVITAGTGISVTYGNGNTIVTNTGLQNTVMKIFSNTASLTQTNPGAGTFVTLFPTGVGSLTIPANTLTAGSVISFRISGIISSLLASAVLRIRLGGSTIAASGSISIGTLTNQYLCVEGAISVYTIGATGTAIGSASVQAPTGIGTTTTSTTVIDTTSALVLDVQFAYGALSISNSFTIVSAVVNLST